MLGTKLHGKVKSCRRRRFNDFQHVRTAIYAMSMRNGGGKFDSVVCKVCGGLHIRRVSR